MKQRSNCQKLIVVIIILLSGMLCLSLASGEAEIAIDETNFPDAVFRAYVEQFDLNGSGRLTEDEIDKVVHIDVSGRRVSSLTGLEYFTSLNSLHCADNNLTSLDVSRNKFLGTLYFDSNQVRNLDISKNKALTFLSCDNNRLTKLDISRNTDLRTVSCANNQLTKLDISKNTDLAYLYCEGNQFTKLDVSHCPALANLLSWHWHEPEVNGSTLRWSADEDGDGYNDAILQVGSDVIITGYEKDAIAINEINFPDAVFREYVKQFDLNGSGLLSQEEIKEITGITVNEQGIKTLKGVEYFTSLKLLYCLSNQLTSLDVSRNTALGFLDCSHNQLDSLDISRNTELYYLACGYNQLSSLEVSRNTALTSLNCDSNQLSSLDVSKNTLLNYLSFDNNKLSKLNISKNTALNTLWCINNQLLNLDVSKNTALKYLMCYGNRISELDLSHCPALVDLISKYEPKDEPDRLLWAVDTDGDSYDDIALGVDKNVTIPGYEREEEIAINTANFPDAAFRKYVKRFDLNGSGGLNQEEIKAVTEISVSNSGIQSLKGIEFFTSLKTLYCAQNLLSGLDVSKNTKLVYLDCGDNKLTSLDISKNTRLQSLLCYKNQLKTLNVSKNTKLKMLECSDNLLKKLDVSRNTALEQLYCSGNQLASLNTVRNTALKTLECFRNQLTSLDVGQNSVLNCLVCSYNKLTALDISKCPILVELVQKVKRVEYDNTVYSWEKKTTRLQIDKTVKLKTKLTKAEKITAFVTRCYELILGRQPDTHGLETWYNNLNSGQKAAAEIIDSFVRSNEFKGKKLSNADAVEILYKTMLGRGSDPKGKANWVAKLDAGQPLAAVINGFCGSNEFKAICDSYGIRPGSVDVPEEVPNTPDDKIKAFVKRCYKIILGRGADETGLNNWFRYLKNKEKAASEIIDGFVNSPEFLGKKYSNEESVEILYKAMLGRGSDPKGKANWVAKLNAGQPFAVVINGFCGSQEFKGLCESYGIIPGSVKVRALSGQTEEELSGLAYNAEEPITKRSEDNPNRVSIINPSDTIDPNIGTAVQAVYINEEKAKEYVSRCYQYILGRSANGNELANWVAQMANGTKTADQIARGFLFSEEFKGRNVSNADLVKILYRVYLNRDADPAGLAGWTAKLDSGVSLKEVLDSLVKTSEYKNVISEMGK